MSVFAGVGERTREGTDLIIEMEEAGVFEKAALVFGQMDEPPGVRLRVALSALTMAEYFRDVQNQDVLLFVDNIFRFVQAGSEVSTLLGRMPSAVGYQPTLADEMGVAAGAHHLDPRPLDHVAAGRVRARRRLHRPGAVHARSPTSTPPPSSVRQVAALGIYPAVDPLASTSTHPAPEVVGDRHYRRRPPACRRSCSATRSCRTSSPSSASTSCPRRTARPSYRARKIQRFLSQPFFVAEVFTGLEGEFVRGRGDRRELRGDRRRRHWTKCPEQAFLNVGGVEQVMAKAKSLCRTGRADQSWPRCKSSWCHRRRSSSPVRRLQVITAPSVAAEIAFLPGHAPFVGALTENHTRITLADGCATRSSPCTAVSSQVGNNKVSILSDIAELATTSIGVGRSRQGTRRGSAPHRRRRRGAGVVGARQRPPQRLRWAWHGQHPSH